VKDKEIKILLVISIISISFSSILTRMSASSPLLIAFYRMALSSSLIFPFLFIKKIKIERKEILLSMLVGIILALHFITWITSLSYTSIASSVILVTSHPFFVSIVSFLLFKEKLHRKSIFGIILAFSGIIILFSSDYFYLPKTFKGDLLAFLGGIFAGTYIIGGRKIRQKAGIFEYNFIVYGTSSIFLLLLCLLFKINLKVSSKEFTIFLLMAIFPTLLGHFLFTFCIKYVKAAVISVSFLGEPIGSSILATILFREVPGIFSMVGGVIILFGIYLVASSEVKNI